MKITLRTMLAGILLMAFMGGSALAQTKIATVDLKKLFDNYYKKNLAQAAIKERADQLDKDDKSMKDDLQKGSDDYKKLLEQANDQALSADERDRRKQAADDKFKELQASKAAIDQFERQASTTLGEQRQRMRDNILVEIKTAVASKAKAAGDTMVFDTAAESGSSTPVIIYSAGENDLTDAVLAQLNAGAPIDLTKPGTTSPPSLTNTPGKP
jgi:outer membrane protein